MRVERRRYDNAMKDICILFFIVIVMALQERRASCANKRSRLFRATSKDYSFIFIIEQKLQNKQVPIKQFPISSMLYYPIFVDNKVNYFYTPLSLFYLYITDQFHIKIQQLAYNKIKVAISRNKMTEKPNEQKKQPEKKIVIKQFEWYEVETKVRELLTELLQPFTKKQTEDTVKLNQFKRTLTGMSKKLQDHDFLLQQESAEKPTYVQLQDDKIQEVHSKMKQIEGEQNKKISDMQKIIEVYENKINQINNLQNRIQEQILARNNISKQHKDYLDKQITLMLSKIDVQDEQINNIRQTTRNALTKTQTKVVVLENRLIATDDQLKRKSQQLKRCNEQITSINQKLIALDLGLKDLDVRLSNRQKDYKLSQKFMARTIQLQNSLTFIEKFLQYYQPLYTQMQISETINSFLKGSQKIRACVFEQKAFAQLHYSILNMEEQTLEAKMADYSNRIRKIINRNKKYVIRLKIEQTVQYGANTYQLRQFDEAMIQRVQKNQQKQQVVKPVEVKIPDQDIDRKISQKIEKTLEKLDQKISSQIEPFKIWVKQIQQQELLKEINFENKINMIQSKFEKQEIALQLFKTEHQYLDRNIKNLADFSNRESKKNKQQIKDLINFSSVINHIVIQDQIDRQGLSLYALKSSPPNKADNFDQTYPNIYLDEKCVACQSGNANVIVNQAFKMACLAYNPSQIKVDDKTFTREEILQISTGILDRLKKKIDELETEKKQRKDGLGFSIPNTEKNTQTKNRSKSLLSKQINNSRLSEYNTIDVPQSSRLKDTTYLLPTLGSIKKKSFGLTNR